MSDLIIGIGASALFWAIALLIGWKFIFWSGPYPPKSGWSPRQLRRMDEGKSPWTIRCAVTYRADRNRKPRG